MSLAYVFVPADATAALVCTLVPADARNAPAELSRVKPKDFLR